MLFTKQHLTGLYNWAPETETLVFDSSPTRRLFNRWNGDQVLFIINLAMERRGDISVELGVEMEKLIINKLPFSPSSELTVFNWLQKEMVNV